MEFNNIMRREHSRQFTKVSIKLRFHSQITTDRDAFYFSDPYAMIALNTFKMGALVKKWVR